MMADSAVDGPNQIQEREERRHPTLYFEDGDIVISATSKTRTYTEFYRVDKIFLGRHSPIFNDMFLVGGSGAYDEQYDGIPRVHLTDHAEDLAGFLSALYNTATLPLFKGCRDTPRKVEGIMRLALKYETESIRQVIIRHIESEWPRTYDEWARWHNERAIAASLLPGVSPPPKPDPALAVRFAMDFNCLEILPAAFYELAIAPDISPKAITWNCLDAADLLRLVGGKKRLSMEWSYFVDRVGECRFGCHDNTCDEEFDTRGYLNTTCEKSVGNCILDAIRHSSVATDPLNLMQQTLNAGKKPFMMFCCEDTEAYIRKEVIMSAQVAWANLPDYFSLSELGYKAATTS